MSVVVFRDGTSSAWGNSPFPAVDKDGQPMPSPAVVAQSGDAAASAETGKRQADQFWFWLGIVILIAGVVVGVLVKQRVDGPVFALSPGIGVFALLFVSAQAIERLSEITSYSPLIGMRRNPKVASTKHAARLEFHTAIAAGVNASTKDDKETAAKTAADADTDLAIINANRACFFFGFNAAIAGIAAGYFEISLLQIIGVTKVPTWLDILVTSLAISGGTKPLHDLISKLESNKQNSENEAQTHTV